MKYFKTIKQPYITGIGIGSNDEEITEDEYNIILAIVQTQRPEAPECKAWALRADTLEYELVDAPEPEEMSEELEEHEDETREH